MTTFGNRPLVLFLDEVEVGESRRALDPEAVSRLAISIKEIGLQHPISVLAIDGRFKLVAGRHRLEAVRELGEDRIEAYAVPMDSRAARMWEISENLHRADLTVQERSDQIAEWIGLIEEGLQSGQLVQNESKREDRRGHRHEGGISAAARQLPIQGETGDAKRKSVERAVKIASITPTAKEAAKEAGIDNNQSKLLKLAAVEPSKQVEAVAKIAKPAKLAPAPLNEFETREQWTSYMMRGWNRASQEWREHFLSLVDIPVFDRSDG